MEKDENIIEKFDNYIKDYVKSDRINHAYLIESNYINRLNLAVELARKIDSFD